MDEEDVLESGIEIVARPPGKRLQNISLLSGGERALVSIALLFAITAVNPPPIITTSPDPEASRSSMA